LWAAFIEHAHDFGIGVVWPGLEPVDKSTCLDLNLLRSASEQPYQECFGRELYPSLATKAAYLFIHIAGGHIFSNGNKRTAVLCLDAFLLANSRYLTLTNTEVRKVAEYVASSGERGVKFPELMEALTELIRQSAISLRALREIDEEEYKQAIRQKQVFRKHPLNQPDTPLLQSDRD
jgi:prophage maintenance system killer protein